MRALRSRHNGILTLFEWRKTPVAHMQPKRSSFLSRLKPRTPAGWGVAAILAAAFGVMLAFNCLTPLISDDYTYLMLYPTTQPLSSVWDVCVSQYNHYMQWGGRTVGLWLEQFFLLLGKGWFNPVNAAAFCLLAYVCAKLAVGRRPVHPLLLAVVLGLLVHFNPCFGAVNLWVSGVFSYLTPLLLGLCFLVPYRLQLDGPLPWGRGAALGMFFAGVLAGWGNENTSGAVLLAALAFLILFRLLLRRVPLWAFCGAGGCLAGFLLLMLAPGQWARNGTLPEDSNTLLTKLLVRLMNATHTLKAYGLWLVVLFGAAYFLLCLARPGAKQLILPLVYFGLALAANYALVLSPVYYIRSYYPVLAFLVLAIGSCLSFLAQAAPHPGRLIPGLLAGVLCALLCFDLLEGGYDIASYHTMRRQREALILQQAAAGEELIETYAVYPYTRFCGAYGQPDLRTAADNWVNVNMALHLGVNGLVATEQHYYPFPGYDGVANTVETQLSLGLE